MNYAPIVLLITTGISALQDAKTRYIDERYFYLAALLLSAYHYFYTPLPQFAEYAASAFVSFFALLIYSNKHPDKLGRGDALYIPLIFYAFGIWETARILLVSAAAAIILSKIKKTNELPLVTLYWIASLASLLSVIALEVIK